MRKGNLLPTWKKKLIRLPTQPGKLARQVSRPDVPAVDDAVAMLNQLVEQRADKS